jgi:DNA-binding beta-propeller fold protein YncE
MSLRWNVGGAVLLAAAASALAPLRADEFPVTAAPVGHDGDQLVTPVNQVVTPAGRYVELPGLRPEALALSPDCKTLVTAGLTHELLVLDPVTGQIRQRVGLPADTMTGQGPVVSAILNPNEKAQLSFTGLKFSPDGTRIYFADVNGDVKVFDVERNGTVSPRFSIPLPPVEGLDRTNEIAAGLAVSADGRRLYVAGNLSNRLLEVEAATGKVLRTWPVGVAPFDVVLAGHQAYVSNWGGRRPDATSVVGPAGHGSLVRTDARGVANEGSVTVIDLAAAPGAASNAPVREIVLGPHASAMALSPNGRWLVVASTGSDLLSVINTRNDEVAESVTARQNPGDLFGAQPDALAFDASGKTLYCANATQNALAVFHFEPGQTRLLGCLPTGWFPSAVVYDARDKVLCVANLKDITRKVEKARVGATGSGFNSKAYAGSLSLIPVPDQADLGPMTRKVLDNLRYPLLAQAGLPPRLNRDPAPVPERAGEASVFKHVLYIIKENRSYDQVLGDVTNGNGAPELCSFGAQVTPNQHQLVHDFVLLDNTYCSGILSADGHNWTDAALASDYLERSFASWPRSYPAGGFGVEGADALAYSPAGFLWDDALAHGKTFHDFGEYTTTKKHWKDLAHTGKIGFAEVWHDFTSGAQAIEYAGQPDIESLRRYMEPGWPSWDLDVPDAVRAAKFTAWLKAREAAGDLPALTILWLPNDHTSGTKATSPTPRAQVADNDLAMGQVVEALSRSKFWTNTCVFAIEDDPQNGWDHVSGYRTTAYVVSAYTPRGATVHTQYNSTSLLRTVELVLGLPPMNQFDATATPMFDCFTNTPNFAAFTAVTNQVPLDEMNPPPHQISDARSRHDAYVSARLPLDQPDRCNEDVLNRILWRATMGAKPYPEWAVKVVDDD